jgi:hypothetical protein
MIKKKKGNCISIKKKRKKEKENTCRFGKQAISISSLLNLQALRVIHSPSSNNNSMSRGFLRPKSGRWQGWI